MKSHPVRLRAFKPEEFDRVLTEMVRSIALVSPAPPDRAEIMHRLEASGFFLEGRLDMGIEVDGRLIGEVDARSVRNAMPAGVFELGIALWAEEDRGHGYGAASVRALAELLFDEQAAHRVQASTSIDNVAMRRALENAGFTFEGILRGFMRSERGPQDYALYAIIKADLTG